MSRNTISLKDWESIERFRTNGYVVVILSPEEFPGLCKEDLENYISNCASDFISDSLEDDEEFDD